MQRFFISLVFLFILTSCSSTSTKITHGDAIPENGIKEQAFETAMIDDGKLNVAILAPLNKQVGQFLVSSAQLALVESHNPDINLVLLDSAMIAEDPNLLKTKLNEQKVKLVLGPIYAPETEKLVSLLRDQQITILSLSNDSSINDPSLLMLGISPESQTGTLIHYALTHNISHFHLLLPSTKYGLLINNGVKDIVGATDHATQTTDWYSTDNIAQVMDEFVARLKANPMQDGKAEAIFMPQGGNSLVEFNKILEKHKFKTRLVGGQAWDNNNILDFPLFDGAILLRQQLANEKFHHEFRQLFHTKPTNLDLIVYNGILMVANMHKHDLALDKQTIIDNNQEFDKYSEVKFTPQGLSIYKMSIVEIHDGQFHTMANPQ